jgi:signal transduction histidine kinase
MKIHLIINKTFVVFVFILIRCIIHVGAQNNPYKINDDLYHYLEHCMPYIKQRVVLSMADTMYLMAKKENDVKAQCLAKNLKGEHYYFIEDLPNLLKQKKIVSDFAIRTPYKQYVFSVWNRVIAYYLSHSMYDEALRDAREYQKEALRLNNSYGIALSYRKLGDIYILLKSPNGAIKEYEKAIAYLKQTGNDGELTNVYGPLGGAYYTLNDFTKAAQYYELALNTSKIKATNGQLYISLADVYLQMGRQQESEKYIQLYEQWKRNNFSSRLVEAREAKYYIKYYLYKQEYDKAMAYCNKLSGLSLYLNRVKIYEAAKDYKNAYLNMKIVNDINATYNDDAQRRTLADYATRFDNQRIENEKNVLALRNAMLQMKELKAKEQLLAAAKEQNALSLSNAQLELRNKRLALQQERAKTERQYSDAHHKEDLFRASVQNAKISKRLATSLIFFSIILIVIFIAYILMRLRSTRRLKEEILEVKKARNDAETARGEAEVARNEALKFSMLQTKFIQNMSHEIRTPLNSIVGFTDLLVDSSNDISDEERKNYTQIIHTNTNLLTTMVNDILDYSSLETGTYTTNIEACSAVRLCRVTLESLMYPVSDLVELRFDEPSEDIEFHTDSMRAQQVLTNFLTNACKHTDKGSIVLSFEKKDNDIIFSVTDTGCGVSPDEADRIFQRFEKIDKFKQGTGLGLNICREIANVLHGSVELDKSYTRGARFLFIHPIAQ